MPETIFKLQPDRTVHLRGFDTFAAAATVHSASASGFQVSGTFRDPADFAVAVLYDTDNFFEHPSLRYLPDFGFEGLTLKFDLHYSTGMQPIDSPKYNWIDWATLDYIRANGIPGKVSLWDNATLAGGSFNPASATFELTTTDNGVKAFDRTTLWFQNLAFDFIAPEGFQSVEYAFYAAGTGAAHWISISGRTYSHVETIPEGESSAAQASALIAAINAASDEDVVASEGSAAHTVLLTVRPSRSGIAIPVSASDGNASLILRLTTPEVAAAAIASQINGTDWIAANSTHALIAEVAGTQVAVQAARYGEVHVDGTQVRWTAIRNPYNNAEDAVNPGSRFTGLQAGSAIRINGTLHTVASVESPESLTLTTDAGTQSGVPYLAPRGGVDGNLLRLYSINKGDTLQIDQAEIQLSGGTSDALWTCEFDFSALGLTELRQLWLTFAPALQNGPFAKTEWTAAFSNWRVTGPEATRLLRVAGPGSVRIEETDSACAFTGAWSVESGFYSKYFAKATSDVAATLTITYHSQFQHNLYIGTSLYSDRAIAGVRLDGDVETSLDCRLASGAAVVARRRIRTAVAAGKHTVSIRLLEAGVFYFDFLEAAVPGDFPDALTARTNISPAIDFDTDHTYKLSPSRLMWSMDKLGYAGPMNEYLGVFWWNERTLSGGSLSTARIEFSGEFSGGDTIFLNLNGTSLGKSVFPSDTLSTIASHFAMWINGAFVGARAAVSDGILTITGRSPSPNYSVSVSMSVTSASGLAAVISAPAAGQYGTWIVDPAADPPLNRAARDWHTDFFALCAARDREVTTACSVELVHPPAEFIARYPDPDRTPVITATGFGSLASAHCAIGNSGMIAYQKSVYRDLASLQRGAGLAPSLQFGEFLWWFFARAHTVSIGYASYTAPISIGTTSPHSFVTGQKVVNSGILGNTAANGEFTITVTDPTHFTLDGSSGDGTYSGGGVSSSVSGMAFYDDETLAAAEAALGRPLYVFATPDDDPAVNGGADAGFLRDRLRDHVAALVADLRAAFPSAKCEVLWPYDVNYPVPVPLRAPYLGGRLNRFINLPVEWEQKPTSGLDRMKVEALAFATGMRDLGLAAEAINLFPSLGWPLDSVRYLVPVFGFATPWHRELAIATGAGLAAINLWAYDHVCLYNLDVPERGLDRRSTMLAA